MPTDPKLTDKMPWKFEPNIDFDQRAPRALEFIAMYLDRIESHLDRIAANAESSQVSGAKIASQITGIAAMLPTLLQGTQQNPKR